MKELSWCSVTHFCHTYSGVALLFIGLEYVGAECSASGSRPSWPLSLLPHAKIWPFLVSASEWLLPAASCMTGRAQRASTRLGVARSFLSPSPSCPEEFEPHAYTWGPVQGDLAYITHKQRQAIQTLLIKESNTMDQGRIYTYVL
jgi:hypothetical protein